MMAPTTFRIAIVGGGPRAVSVLERLACRLAESSLARSAISVEVYVVDNVAAGTGRLWRTDQAPWLIMNTNSAEVTMFSGDADNGTPRPGAGPSLAQWWQPSADHRYGPYAPRYVFGEYLNYVISVIDRQFAAHRAELRRITGTVTRVVRAEAGSYRLILADGSSISADRVVLATGQPYARASDAENGLAAAARDSTAMRYFPGESAADMDFSAIEPGEPVGIIGLGLGFYDVLACLTLGRGGTFGTDGRYVPSGNEPVIVAGSRSGMPFFGRGRNQRPPDLRYSPRLLRIPSQSGQVDFGTDVIPLLTAEMSLVYYETLAHRHLTATQEGEFNRALAKVIARNSADPAGDIEKVAAAFGLHDEPMPDLLTLTRPFGAQYFSSQAAFTAELQQHMVHDLSRAEEGNLDNPLKAALETLRLLRPAIRQIVEFDGLTPRSHKSAFLRTFVPSEAMLTSGPPATKVAELLSLMEIGVVTIAGPGLRVRPDRSVDRYTLWSPQIRHCSFGVRTLIDSRIPKTDIRHDPEPLIAAMREDGMIRSHVIPGISQGFDTGGVDVTRRPFHPVRADGQPDPGIYVIGLPTEGARWYTQIGSSRPGYWNDFTRDADAVAKDLVEAMTL